MNRLIVVPFTLIITGCNGSGKVVEFTSYANGLEFTAMYENLVWDYDVESKTLKKIDDENCRMALDAGGKGLMGTDYKEEEAMYGAVKTIENIEGEDVVIWISKKIGSTEEKTLVQAVLGTSTDPEACEEAFYRVLNTIQEVK